MYNIKIMKKGQQFVGQEKGHEIFGLKRSSYLSLVSLREDIKKVIRFLGSIVRSGVKITDLWTCVLLLKFS